MKFEKSGAGYDQLDRYVYQLYQRRRELYELQWSQPLVPLENPYIRGKVRYFILGPSLLKRKDVEELQDALEYFKHKQYSRNGNFTYRDGKSKKWIPYGMKPTTLSLGQVVRARVPEHLLKYFVELSKRPVKTYDRLYQLQRNHYPHHLRFAFQDQLEIEVDDHWITHQRANMPAVDAELAEIEKVFENPKFAKRHPRYSYRNPYATEKRKRRMRTERRCAERQAHQEYYESQDDATLAGKIAANMETIDQIKKGEVLTSPFFALLLDSCLSILLGSEVDFA